MKIDEKTKLEMLEKLQRAIKHHKTDEIHLARPLYVEILEKFPNHPTALGYMGVLEHQTGNLEKALDHMNKALKIDPGNPTLIYNKAGILRNTGQYDEAIKFYQLASSFRPDSSKIHADLGSCFAETGQYTDAIYYYDKAIALDSKNANAIAGKERCAEITCDWENYDERLKALGRISDSELKYGQNLSTNPFSALYMPWSSKKKLLITTQHYKKAENKVRAIKQDFNFDRHNNDRIRIGYVSSDFRDHTVGYLIQNLFSAHDRKQFEIYAYSFSDSDNSDIRNTIEKDCDHFTDLTHLSLLDAAKKIYQDKIQILVNLTGFTTRSFMEIFALKPAPIQVNYLGFLGSLGASTIDYIIADDTVILESDEEHYVEKVVRLPDTYQINSHQIPVEEAQSRDTYGLPDNAFVFCCFNNYYKIEPGVFTIWMKLLQEIPKSVLWLFNENETGANNLRNQAIKHGVNPERLIFAEKLTRPEHITRHQVADLYLDTFIASARTSASDALWAGLPVLTLPGDHFCNRVGASLLRAINLPEMIANSTDDYFDKAIYYAKNRDKLTALKEKLAANIKTQPMFDTQLFIKNLEAGYKEMWRVYSEGAPTQHIKVIPHRRHP